MEQTAYGEAQSGIVREEPEADPARKNLVAEWQSKIEKAKKHWEKDFKRMRQDMQLVYAGAPKEWVDAESYVVPIIGRHINQAVSSLYARNPRVAVERKKRVEYALWDGKAETLRAAMESTAAMMGPQVDPATGAVMPPAQPDPEALALLQEVAEVQQRHTMLKRVSKTMEVLLHYYMQEQSPGFKKQLKQLVRRTKTCGVGFIFLGFQRLLEKRPEIAAQIEDVSAQIARIESLSADLLDDKLPEDSPRVEELRSMQADLQRQVEIIVREGPVFDFPRSTEIIIDPKCKQLNTLSGAGWFAREFHLSADEVQEIYKVDVKSTFKGYQRKDDKDGSPQWVTSDDDGNTEQDACVWEVWCKTTGQTFTLIDGYCDFVKEPAAPEIRLERFWPLFVLTFNDVEHETQVYPLSDAHMLRHSQMEYNRSREGRRQHRKSNQPMYVSVRGRLSEEDKAKLATRPPFAIVELGALQQGEKAENLLQAFKPVPMDPSLYETNSEMEDVYRTVGVQEANIGGTSGATATEVSVGEQSRSSSQDSNIDDLDDFLSEVVQATGQMLLLALDVSTVKRIAGSAAEWPQMSRQEVMEELSLDIKAGSSGRPNKAAELANMERAAPFLMQIGGVNMTPMGEKYAMLLDMDTEEMIAEGLPSQVALNAMASKAGAQVGTGDPASDPASQGAQGVNNAATTPDKVEGGPQPAYPVAQYDATGRRVAA